MVEPVEEDQYFLEELEQHHSVSGFKLGDSQHLPLKTFVRRYAKDYHKNNLAKTYVIRDNVNPPRVWAYMSLICSQVSLNKSHRPNDCAGSSKYRDYPAVKIARIAVDKRKQGMGLGHILMQWAIATA